MLCWPRMSLLLLAVAIAGGTAATYLYEDDEGIGSRVAAGVPIGIIVLGLAGFLVSWALGLGAVPVALATLVALLPVLTLRSPSRRALLRADLASARSTVAAGVRRPSAVGLATAVFYAGLAFVLFRVFDRAMFEGPGGAILTGVDHNLGDLPFHVAIITSFLHGGNIPPEHPELAGARLTYPFVVDFVAAMLVRAGATLRQALLAENMALGLAVVALLHRWSARFTRERGAGLLAPLLVLFSGGLGFILLGHDVDPEADGLVGLLRAPTHDYTILPDGPYRWGNVIITMLIPQRSFLLGLPAFLVIATLWWRAVGERDRGDDGLGLARARRRLLAAGILTGLLPLAHAHAFAIAMAVGLALAVRFPDARGWGRALAAAAVIASPQVLLVATGSAMRASSFLGWQAGWDRGGTGAVLFWWLNLGLFLPLVILAVAWRRGAPPVDALQLRFWTPFAFCFLVPNVLRLSPWIWDNIKFLVFFHVASAPLVALVLARAWRAGNGAAKAAALMAFVVLTASGALDVYRVAGDTIAIEVFSPRAVAFGDVIRETTPPGALVLHAPTFNSEVYLAGRRTLVGYPGHIWSQGLDAGTREEDVKRIYGGGPGAPALLARYGIDHVLVGPRERSIPGLSEDWLSALDRVAERGEYALYRVR